MVLVIRNDETQKAFVRRMLSTRGHISVQECLYEMVDEYDHTRAVTRLAAIIFNLRNDGMVINESSPGTTTSVYTLVEKSAVEEPATPRKTGTCPKCPRILIADQPTIDPRIWSAKCYTDGRVYIRVDQ
jgi:hypothetical protein